DHLYLGAPVPIYLVVLRKRPARARTTGPLGDSRPRGSASERRTRAGAPPSPSPLSRARIGANPHEYRGPGDRSDSRMRLAGRLAKRLAIRVRLRRPPGLLKCCTPVHTRKAPRRVESFGLVRREAEDHLDSHPIARGANRTTLRQVGHETEAHALRRASSRV